jgi:hypothetical protein
MFILDFKWPNYWQVESILEVEMKLKWAKENVASFQERLQVLKMAVSKKQANGWSGKFGRSHQTQGELVENIGGARERVGKHI